MAYNNKEYMATYMRERRRKRIARIRQQMGDVCRYCGNPGEEIDHINPASKRSDVSSANCLDGPWDRIWDEVLKCQILCRECHISKSKTDISKINTGRPGNFGEESCNSVLTEVEVLSIRERYKSQNPRVTQQELGNEYGVSRETIKEIIHRRTWKHI